MYARGHCAAFPAVKRDCQQFAENGANMITMLDRQLDRDDLPARHREMYTALKGYLIDQTARSVQAHQAAESLTRGTRVVVTGRLRQRPYETREGEKRTVYEVEADDVSVSLKFAVASKRSLRLCSASSRSRIAARSTR